MFFRYSLFIFCTFCLQTIPRFAFGTSKFTIDAQAVTAIIRDPEVWRNYRGRILGIKLISRGPRIVTFRFTIEESKDIWMEKILSDGQLYRYVGGQKPVIKFFEATVKMIDADKDGNPPSKKFEVSVNHMTDSSNKRARRKELLSRCFGFLKASLQRL